MPYPAPAKYTYLNCWRRSLPRKKIYSGWSALVASRSLAFSLLASACFFPVAHQASAQLKAAPAATATAAPVSLEDRRKELNAVINEYWQESLKRAPEFASSIGDLRYNDKLSDYSVRSANEFLDHERNYLMRLASVEPTGLTEQEQLSRELLMRQLSDDEEAASYKEWELSLNQMGGIHTTYPQLVAQLPFNTVKDYDDWIARLHAIPQAFAQVTENLSIGMEDHRTPPRFLLEKTLDQVKDLAHQKPEDSPLALPLKKMPASIPAAEQTRIHDEMLAAIAKDVLPAYLRFERFLTASYVPAGRTEPGISAIPDGTAYYQFLLKRTTTTDLTAAQIHQIGLDEVTRDEAEMLAIAQKLGYKDLASFRTAIKADPKQHATDSDSLLASYRATLIPMQAKLPELFGRLPKAPFEVVKVPDYLEKTSAPAYYENGTPDGSRPGRLFIDTYNAPTRNLYSTEAVAYHEGLPGHHLQISIAQELTGVPDFRKYGGYTAFVEGWGLYAERLGKDAGFYTDPYRDYGRLETDIWRAIRLVVDTGVHSKHWSRQQMVDFFHAHTAIDEVSLQAEVDRYIAWPGQATAYKIGQLEILALRDRAKKALGPRFDIRGFHDQVLDSGALPLDLLEARIDSWIAAQQGSAAK